MLNIQTFDARAGGNVLYKALAHPLAAEALGGLFARLRAAGRYAVYDADGIIDALLALYPDAPAPDAVFVHATEAVGATRAGHPARPVTELGSHDVATVLVAAFDADRAVARARTLARAGTEILSLDAARIPDRLLTNPRRYLDRLNFATNFVFFRDEGGLSTRLVTANYWAGYGAGPVRLWLRLFDAAGAVLAEWEEALADGPSGYALDSAEVRARFGLGPFTGQVFLHAVGAAGHDVIKYALDTYATGNGASLSCTHDANAWPSDRYAGLPAPRADERVLLWIQNSHATPIPAGAIALDRMGAEAPVAHGAPVGPFATVALDVADLLPGLRWPAQVEVRTGRHVVRPRYEVVRDGRTRIAHVNVERADLRPDPAVAALPDSLGRGFILPFPVLPRDRFRSIVQPTPMAETQADLPLRLDVFDAAGTRHASRFLGRLPRAHDLALEVEDVAEGHAELVYDFRDGGGADGWMHALMRYEDRESGHAAETSFGAHVFNTAMTWRDEPQSYSGPPPGLSTRLFLKLGDGARHSFACLIYAASAPWHPQSDTTLLLHDETGAVLAEERLRIACQGSAMVWPHAVFGEAALRRAGRRGYVIVRDTTCRLFGYHGLMDARGGFSLDHMFGF
ncbi:hypothetical protein [Acidisphaera rubrifaciens]|uniref:Uncharacterized protein n=1 Tax=Acidisphaera rubrifaciens HS-AP3 TaxID=1231350 RepID=A0A0D6P8K7_9PROT|nr:hypothetical protein [Acidisphaera rubrifaciens]GAN77179.1 hypothetical protein Asru_0250_03 [Acidisphaera rubrifaciens HS-AP3]